jgi:hypothetical protein
MTIRRVRAWLPALAVATLTANAAHAQQSGSLGVQTATVLKGGNTDPSIDIDINGGTSGKPNGTTTRVLVEIGADGQTFPVPDPNLPNTVVFKVSKMGVAGTADFTTIGGSEAVKFAPKVVVLLKGFEDPMNARGLYVLAISHTCSPTPCQGVPANATETWKLEITGLPMGLRVAYAITDGTFKGLAPTGVCGGGTSPPPCPGVCPVGQSCQPYRIPPWWKYIEVAWFPKWPPPGPPCLSCPRPWELPTPEGFERVMVVMTPYITADAPLGPGRAEQVKMSISGGEAIGPVFDTGRGDYMQMIQRRVGNTVRASASVGDVRSEEVVVGMNGGVNPRYRTFTYLLLVLLIIALIVIWSLTRRRVRLAQG